MNGEILGNENVEHDPADELVIGEKSKRQYDIVVLGASGFTGQFVVKEMGYFSQLYNLTWAIAGRNTNKLQKVLDNMYKTHSK